MGRQTDVHMGGGFGGVNVSYNHLEAAGAGPALERQLALHAAVRAATSARCLRERVWGVKVDHPSSTSLLTLQQCVEFIVLQSV